MAGCDNPLVREEHNWSVIARWVNVFFRLGDVGCSEVEDVKLKKPRSLQCCISTTGKQKEQMLK